MKGYYLVKNTYLIKIADTSFKASFASIMRFRKSIPNNKYSKKVLANSKSHDSSQLYLKSPKYVFNESKKSIDSGTCIIMLDFAENYQYVLQDEI